MRKGGRIRPLYAHYDGASGVTSIKSFRKNYVFVKSMRSITAVSHITWTLQKSTTATHNIRPINESDLMQPSLTRTSWSSRFTETDDSTWAPLCCLQVPQKWHHFQDALRKWGGRGASLWSAQPLIFHEIETFAISSQRAADSRCSLKRCHARWSVCLMYQTGTDRNSQMVWHRLGLVNLWINSLSHSNNENTFL